SSSARVSLCCFSDYAKPRIQPIVNPRNNAEVLARAREMCHSQRFCTLALSKLPNALTSYADDAGHDSASELRSWNKTPAHSPGISSVTSLLFVRQIREVAYRSKLGSLPLGGRGMSGGNTRCSLLVAQFIELFVLVPTALDFGAEH